jgi:hypothetical protein
MRNLVAATVLIALVSGACSSPTSSASQTPGASAPASPGASLETTTSPTVSVAPTPSASTSPSVGTMQIYPPGAAVEVAVTELNLRRRASTGAKRLETLQRGEVLIISPIDFFDFGYGPVKANGYTWYPAVKIQVRGPGGKLPALPTSPLKIGTEPVSGWIAADDGTRPFVAALPPRCPASVDLKNLEGMLPAERLACFGGPIVLEGTIGCGGCGGINPSVYKPRWLIDPLSGDFLSSDPATRIGPIELRFPPDGPARPTDGSIIRVTVHLDDPRSTNCSIKLADDNGNPTIVVDPSTAVLFCRERLVVESYHVIGTDPRYPG